MIVQMLLQWNVQVCCITPEKNSVLTHTMDEHVRTSSSGRRLKQSSKKAGIISVRVEVEHRQQDSEKRTQADVGREQSVLFWTGKCYCISANKNCVEPIFKEVKR